MGPPPTLVRENQIDVARQLLLPLLQLAGHIQQRRQQRAIVHEVAAEIVPELDEGPLALLDADAGADVDTRVRQIVWGSSGEDEHMRPVHGLVDPRLVDRAVEFAPADVADVVLLPGRPAGPEQFLK